MVEHAAFFRHVEGTEAELFGKPPAARTRVVAFSGDGGPCAIELFRPSRAGECLKRVQAEPRRMRIESGERRCAAHVRNPGARRRGPCDFANRGIGNAQQHQFGVIGLGEQAALGETAGNRRSHPASSNDLDAFEHVAPCTL